MREWLSAMEACVGAHDYEGCRQLFTPEAEGFGTRAFIADGREAIERDQWRQVWPQIRGFRFVVERLRVHSANGLVALHVPFDSRAVAPDGAERPRRGRATLVLRESGGRLTAVHTHFSLDPS